MSTNNNKHVSQAHHPWNIHSETPPHPNDTYGGHQTASPLFSLSSSSSSNNNMQASTSHIHHGEYSALYPIYAANKYRSSSMLEGPSFSTLDITSSFERDEPRMRIPFSLSLTLQIPYINFN